jgi:hypothetical protein
MGFSDCVYQIANRILSNRITSGSVSVRDLIFFVSRVQSMLDGCTGYLFCSQAGVDPSCISAILLGD